MTEKTPLLSVRGAKKSYLEGGFFARRRHPVLEGVSFDIAAGEPVALLGSSGEGKSTLSRLLLGLEAPDAGSVLIEGIPVSEWKRKHPGGISAVFQDSAAAADPRWTAAEIIAEPLAILGKDGRAAVPALLRAVRLPEDYAGRYPHELSGGELQRVCIARAISTRPKLIVFDEAVSSLDVSAQAHILGLIRELSSGTAFLFITHDIQAAASICERILFLDEGKITEDIAARDLARARSDCARRLLSAVIPF